MFKQSLNNYFHAYFLTTKLDKDSYNNNNWIKLFSNNFFFISNDYKRCTNWHLKSCSQYLKYELWATKAFGFLGFFFFNDWIFSKIWKLYRNRLSKPIRYMFIHWKECFFSKRGAYSCDLKNVNLYLMIIPDYKLFG